jgi:zinc protease
LTRGPQLKSRIESACQLALRSPALLSLLLLPALACPGFPAGRYPESPQLVMKGKAPVNPDLLKVSLPRPAEARLPNGLRVIVIEDHKIPTFTMEVVVLAGGLSDPPDHPGVASFTASLLRAGAGKRSSRQIAEDIDSLGVALNAGAGGSTGTSNISASGLVESLDQVLDLVADIVINPKFPADEVEKFKSRTLSQYELFRSDPHFLSEERLSRAIYGSHPAGSLLAPIDSIKKTSPGSLALFHSTYYRPNNSILAIAGDVTLSNLIGKIERAFGGWRMGAVPSLHIPDAPQPGPARLLLVDRPGSVQTVLRLGVPGLRRTDPDYFSMLVMDRVVGGSPVARLFMNLREDKGYAYNVYSSFSALEFRGVWRATCEAGTDVTAPALQCLLDELRRIREEPVSTPELANAKRGLIGGFAISVERPRTLLQNIITQNTYRLPVDYWDKYPENISAITAEDVARVAKRYLDPSHLQIVAVGDAAKIKDVLSKIASSMAVEVYGADGELIKSARGK